MAICAHTHVHTGPSAPYIQASEPEEPGRLPPRLDERVIATITTHGIITMATSRHIIMLATLPNTHGSLFSADVFLISFSLSLLSPLFLIFPFLLLLILISSKGSSNLTSIVNATYCTIINENMKVEDKTERERDMYSRWYKNLNFLLPT